MGPSSVMKVFNTTWRREKNTKASELHCKQEQKIGEITKDICCRHSQPTFLARPCVARYPIFQALYNLRKLEASPKPWLEGDRLLKIRTYRNASRFSSLNRMMCASLCVQLILVDCYDGGATANVTLAGSIPSEGRFCGSEEGPALRMMPATSDSALAKYFSQVDHEESLFYEIRPSRAAFLSLVSEKKLLKEWAGEARLVFTSI